MSAQETAAPDVLRYRRVQCASTDELPLGRGRVDQAALGRPARELVAVGELELAQDGGDVGLDGLRRDAEAQGDLLVEIAAGDVLDDLALAWGEVVELGIGGGRGARAGVATREG